MGIGRRIKQRREELGMTQEELAKRLGYKSKSTVNKVELEINDITQSKINAYANALDTTVISLMGYEEDDSILSKETLLTIGNKISHQRKLLNISADDLSKQLGISRATLYRYENGDVKKIPSTILNPLATILQTTPADLMGWNDIDTLKPEISTLGEKIKQLRSNMNISQVDFATKIGVSKQTLYKYENNIITNIPFDKIEDIARIANVSPAYLMGWAEFGVGSELKKIIENLPSDISAYETKINSTPKGVTINVLGRVAAGIPIEAIEEIIDTEEISQEMASTGEFFGLKIHGDSMEPRMYEGDVVIVRKQEDADSGDIVIAMVNGDDATCKRLVKYENGINLLSLNSKYAPIVFSKEEIETKPVRIIGKVVELRGKF